MFTSALAPREEDRNPNAEVTTPEEDGDVEDSVIVDDVATNGAFPTVPPPMEDWRKENDECVGAGAGAGVGAALEGSSLDEPFSSSPPNIVAKKRFYLLSNFAAVMWRGSANGNKWLLR